MSELSLRLGLTMWSHNDWLHSFYGSGTKSSQRLERYASVFHTVEGNTTFYATPSDNTVNNWNKATPEHFRFTFKLPKSITHEQQLRHCQAPLHDFLATMSPLREKLGMLTIQLPRRFGPNDLPALQSFCQYFPNDMPLGVEVRHPAFFQKGPHEKALNQWLLEHGIDRIIMDSRPVFAAEPNSPAVIDAHNNKPKVPVHAISTGQHPMIRFIGHPDLEANNPFFKPWLSKLPEWIAQGKQPYLMIHTPDNQYAPELALQLYTQLQQHIGQVPGINQVPGANHPISLPSLASFPPNADEHQIAMF
ncbi:DUF72 domain-containing protein [Vibrio sp. ZSDZ65]|uniref:DUF72 domain-containing protein n=1 Tax=Vibrio qingdaonensis TaxID=2829491 RepID=A0A9X3CNA5_9VIBR|nr:DUF72 domain-containing protein [Vibrio qingdaonensis]MCW8346528.1 DUF72 domain-containing protein [Vibrio qingdaonensis]